ncbi:energy transducer TonB [Mucilaginibacter myungsuensis]|uniref:Energy transducer TonB n=1 Tax=Mucilaginibacter myungsuensis TaxID=649104 RepID=A0A929KUR1_9SPHI|nr:energy transducer TonB [Mucilaginibacter myungsuensis]MBE9661127.1 energy transducer TonB [Mucilaginibacter myungsuensis]MDN3597272.1 energy transducer TonB [Mucilaginibacter myungsuensis]
MDDSKKDISQIKKYLEGELDARAMHKLEREAQDDPFLMDALEGFESAGGPDAFNFDELDARLAQRIAPAKVRSITPWRYYAAAAAVLLFFSIGYILWPKGAEVEKQQVADLITPPATEDRTAAPIDTTSKTLAKEAAIAAEKQVTHTPVLANKVAPNKEAQQSPAVAEAFAAEVQQEQMIAAVVAKARMAQAKAYGAVGKADTQVYITDVRQVPADKRYPKGKLDSILKNINGYVVDKNGNVAGKKSTDSILAASLVSNKNNSVGNIGRADANMVVRGYVSKDQKDTTKVTEISLPGVPKVTESSIAANKAAQPQALDGKVKDVNLTTPPKPSSILMKELGAPVSPNLEAAVKKEAKDNSLGKFNAPVSSHAGLSDREKTVSEKAAQAKVGGFDKMNTEVIKTAHPKMGWDAYDKYLKAKATGTTSGTVRVSFTVDAKGRLGDLKVVKGINETVDKKAIELIKSGPAWLGDVSGKVTTITQKVVFSKE